LGQSEDSFLQRELERASADEAEAIVFLASIIPMRSRAKIRAEIHNSRPAGMNDFLFGTRVRNLLRMGGFQYRLDVMESIWFSWLKKAVNLPEDMIVLTDSTRERIRKYKSIFRKPPLRPPLDPREIENAKQAVEKRLSIKLPEIDVRYSDSIQSAMCLSASEPTTAIDNVPHL
jgi:hypothetical protein